MSEVFDELFYDEKVYDYLDPLSKNTPTYKERDCIEELFKKVCKGIDPLYPIPNQPGAYQPIEDCNHEILFAKRKKKLVAINIRRVKNP